MKKILSVMISIALVLSSMAGIVGDNVKAKSFNHVFVTIASDTGIEVQGNSTKLNGLDAICDLVGAENVIASPSPYGGSYLAGINGLNENKYNMYDGWNYVIYRDGSYITPYDSIDTLTLQNNDEFIVYYGAWGVTYFPNDVEFSTYTPNQPLTITINNIDWEGKTAAIVGAKVFVDGVEVAVNENKVVLPSGLSEGSHEINIKGYVDASVPSVAEVTLNVYIKYPIIPVKVLGLDGVISEGNVQSTDGNINVLGLTKSLLDSKSISYDITTSSFGDYLNSIDGLAAYSLGSANYDGWMYYIKNSSNVIAPMVGMSSYVPEDGDSVVIYYGDMLTKYLYSTKFTPNIVEPNEAFTMQLIDQKGLPIASANLTVNSKIYKTDNFGKINIEGLAAGSYDFSLKASDKEGIPYIIADDSSFTIDGYNSPAFNLNHEGEEVVDNSLVDINIEDIIKSTSAYVKLNIKDSFSALSLYKLGLTPDDSFIEEYANDIKDNGVEDYSNTDLEKLIIGLVACGYSPYNLEENDLVSELFNRNIDDFLINDLAFALITSDFINIDDNYKIKKQDIMDRILSLGFSYNYGMDYGFALAYDESAPLADGDITGLVISALAPYYKSDSNVKEAIDKALKTLKGLENNSGYIPGKYGISSETNSFVILGLTAMGVDPQGEDFSKIKGNLAQGLLSLYNNDGTFKHAMDGDSNNIATEQALRALIAISNYKSEGYNYYGNTIDAKTLKIYNEDILSNSEITQETLPKTGGMDIDLIIILGILLIFTGLAINKKRLNA
ncbi:MAG: DUF4430 domain-containing protein [Clostridiaceae bacterium]